ncbi:MAG: YciI-like protein [Candidatus Sulfotelmatobacter sp.]
MHYFLFYEVGEDYVSRRAEFRDAHLEKAWASSARGELVLGGALANPPNGAVLLFKGDSPTVAENFAKADPYVTNGLVKRWHVREWMTVAGEDAANPVRPGVAVAKKRSSDPAVAGSASSQEDARLILRMWKARSTVEKSDHYIQHATTRVFPALGTIKGHRGAYLLERPVDGEVEFVVLTLWESMEAVREFAGAEPENAVVEPEARAVLTSFDESATHFEIVRRPGKD